MKTYKKRGTAIALAFFLGNFGAQKFYLGKTGYGVLCLLFSWTLIPSFFAVFDMITLAFMEKSEFDSIYND